MAHLSAADQKHDPAQPHRPQRPGPLLSLQHFYLISQVIKRDVYKRQENYRDKREQSLQHLARKVAAKVTKYRRSVTLEPMNAYERHVIHTALQDVPNVTTYSTGTEPNRRVIVAYDREKK